jgi:hypothetical protein
VHVFETDIAQAERLITGPVQDCHPQSSGEKISEMQVRLQKMLGVLLLLQDQPIGASRKPITIKQRPVKALAIAQRSYRLAFVAAECRRAARPLTSPPLPREPADASTVSEALIELGSLSQFVSPQSRFDQPFARESLLSSRSEIRI